MELLEAIEQLDILITGLKGEHEPVLLAKQDSCIPDTIELTEKGFGAISMVMEAAKAFHSESVKRTDSNKTTIGYQPIYNDGGAQCSFEYPSDNVYTDFQEAMSEIKKHGYTSKRSIYRQEDENQKDLVCEYELSGNDDSFAYIKEIEIIS